MKTDFAQAINRKNIIFTLIAMDLIAYLTQVLL